MNETLEQAALRIGKEIFGAEECCLSGEGERDREVTVSEYPIGEDCIKFANRIAALVAAAERERCAKVCDENAKRNFPWGSENSDRYHAQADWAERCAAAIRALT